MNLIEESEKLRALLRRAIDNLEDLNCAWLDQAEDCAEPDEERENCAAASELIEEARAALARPEKETRA